MSQMTIIGGDNEAISMVQFEFASSSCLMYCTSIPCILREIDSALIFVLIEGLLINNQSDTRRQPVFIDWDSQHWQLLICLWFANDIVHIAETTNYWLS